MVYLVGDLENAKAFMLMKYGTKNFYDRSYNLTANKHLAPCYPLDGRNLYKVVKLDEDFLNDLVIVIVPFTHITSMTEEQRSKLNNILKTYKDWQNLDPYQARLVVDRLLSSNKGGNDFDLSSYQNKIRGYSNAKRSSLPDIQEQETIGVYVPKRVATGSNLRGYLQTKPKPKKEFVQQCNYSELKSLVNNPTNYKQVTGVEGTYFSGFDGSPRKLSDFLTKYFGSEYWNLPVKGYRLDYNGKFYAGSVSIDVTGLSTSVLVNGYHSMREDWAKVLYRGIEGKIEECYRLFYNSEYSYANAIPLKYTPLTLLNFSNDLKYSEEGIFLEMGLVKPLHEYDVAFINIDDEQLDMSISHITDSIVDGKYKYRLYKTDTRYAIQEWKSTHQKVVECAKYGESEWLHRDLSEIVTPQHNTKIIYVCYLPQTKVIKVGRTRNWGSRKGVYSRFKGDSKLTSGIMRLCYYWNVISTGDEVVDRFLMYCAEDHLKLLANHRMRVVEGKEFFKGYDLNEFIREVRSYFESLSVSRLISIRDTSKIKRFCSGESYDYDRLMQRLRELKEKN